MQVIEFKEFGSPSQLHLAERPLPQADANSAIVRIEAASVNPSDLKNVAGRMSQTTLPRIPGRDYSGVVVDGPKKWIDRAVWGSGGDVGFTRDGTHAECIQVPVASLALKPERLSHVEAGAVGVTFVAAWCALVAYARLMHGETVAIFGATGGVGGAAVQIAKNLGARVIAINRAGSPASSPVVGLADVQLDSGDPELPSTLRSFNSGRGADVVLNTAGGSLFQVGLELLAHRGRQIEITSPPMRRVSMDLVDFYHNESQLFGVDSLKFDLTATARILEKLRPGFETGAYLPPMIADTIPLNHARNAYERVANGEHGRMVLKPH
ncbi:NADPH:quinone reductase-like Zn-dependent oxidoreductase [Silvibacterium bohemicum]|uniref:NADPH:quinone reductase-like Zn-dependent oxidoreductase n=1 Tax=Silvibacterium bohemicum TaxID=1577686 RepID=A0A841K619_9BACT|nr:zinc-binding alcohol dehydrogenase family protein [Silvibacterium bohemicum]MBB6147399.1 NADPH:quinone reductase-like Zn-dependent oxidoreductase [Silvibacterium bohemicum]